MDLSFLISLFQNYGILIAFLGGIVGGEETILAFSFLSANSFFPLWWIFVFTYSGVFLLDMVIFLIGKHKLIHNFSKTKKASKAYLALDKTIKRVSRENIFFTLFYSKFIYGTRTLTILYLGTKNIKYKKFLVYDLMVILAWLTPITLIGWFIGGSFKALLNIFRSLRLAIFLLVMLIILLYLTKKWIEKRLLKRQKLLK